MICDADSHFTLIDIIGKIDPDLRQRLLAHCSSDQQALDAEWNRYYNIIKGPSWPACETVADITSLPIDVKREIKNDFDPPGLYMSEDFGTVHYDPPINDWPNLETQEKTAKLLLKVDRQLLNPNTSTVMFDPINYHHDPALVPEFTKIWNDECLKLVEENDFFDVSMFLPLQNFEFSMQEFERLKDKKYFAVRLIDHYPFGFIRQFDELWEACEKNNIPIYLHLNSVFEPAPLNWKWDYHNERYQAMIKQWPYPRFRVLNKYWITGLASFITEGVLDRYPNLRIITCEHHLYYLKEMRDFMISHGWPDPMPYWKKNFWWTVDTEEENFLENARIVGFDRLMFSTDYPHNDAGGMNRYKDVDDINSMLAQNIVTQDEYDWFTHKNYLKMLNRV